MSLQPGHKLARYEILESIGKGGMGEVYRARDGKLGRDVAVKVLPEELALDTERLERFQREAQVLASLNHLSIGPIYGLEESEGTHGLILERAREQIAWLENLSRTQYVDPTPTSIIFGAPRLLSIIRRMGFPQTASGSQAPAADAAPDSAD